MTPPLPPANEVDYAASVLRIMADKTRLSILHLLYEQEMTVGAIADALQHPLPGVSQHLAKLRAAHVVSVRRDGTSIFYSQTDPHLNSLIREAFRFTEHRIYAEPPHHH